MCHSAAGDAIDDGEPEDEHITTTARERAVRVIDSGLIMLDTEMAVFVVSGTNQRKDYHIGTLSKVNNIIYCKNDVLAE